MRYQWPNRRSTSYAGESLHSAACSSSTISNRRAAGSGPGPTAPLPASRRSTSANEPGFESGSFAGCLFLSCDMTPAQAGYVTIVGGTVVRDDGRRPYPAHRSRLYTPAELFAGFDPSDPDGYAASYDATVYRHWIETGRQFPADIEESLTRRLHDHSITDALHELLTDADRCIAIMGGHGIERSSDAYARVTRIARRLTRRGALMLSGGGPGAMEATHLGAYLAHFDDDTLGAAVELLGPRPAGAAAGQRVRRPRLAPSGVARARAVPAAARRGALGFGRHPHVDVRPRATLRVRHPDREVLRQQCP